MRAVIPEDAVGIGYVVEAPAVQQLARYELEVEPVVHRPAGILRVKPLEVIVVPPLARGLGRVEGLTTAGGGHVHPGALRVADHVEVSGVDDMRALAEGVGVAAEIGRFGGPGTLRRTCRAGLEVDGVNVELRVAARLAGRAKVRPRDRVYPDVRQVGPAQQGQRARIVQNARAVAAAVAGGDHGRVRAYAVYVVQRGNQACRRARVGLRDGHHVRALGEVVNGFGGDCGKDCLEPGILRRIVGIVVRVVRDHADDGRAGLRLRVEANETGQQHA